MDDEPQKDVRAEPIEVPESAWEPPARRPAAAQRVFGPIVAGLIIDLIDLATFGPIGIILGLALGGGVAWYICSLYGLPLKQKLLWSLAAGVYCTIPFTEFIPVGTLVGAFIRYRELKEQESRPHS